MSIYDTPEIKEDYVLYIDTDSLFLSLQTFLENNRTKRMLG